jgi:hypothetical protein
MTPHAAAANQAATERALAPRSGIDAARLDALTRAALGRANHRIHRMGVDRWRIATLRAAIHRRKGQA